MKKEALLVLLTSFLEDKVEQIKNELVPIKGERGLRGKAGRSFEFEEHQERILSEITTYIDSIKSEFKLTFVDLSEEDHERLSRVVDARIESLKSDEPDFDEEKLSEIVRSIYDKTKDEFKLRFEDLSEDEKESLRGDTVVGPRGRSGKSFNFDESKPEISSILLDFFNSSKDELKLKFNDLSEEDRASLKLKFIDLTEDDVNSLKVKGPRGQKGKVGATGEDGNKWLSGKGEPDCLSNENDLYLDTISGDVYRFDTDWTHVLNIKGEDGLSVQGPIGLPGVMGRAGREGLDGQDAAEIVDVKVTKHRNAIRFEFYFSDGNVIETNRIDLPSMQNLVSVVNSFGSSGGTTTGGTQLEVLKDDVLVGTAEQLNFEGDNISVAWDAVDNKATVTVTEPESSAIEVQDEGSQITTSVNTFDFVGDGIEVLVQTTLGDWVTISEVDPLTEEFANPGFVQVRVDAPTKFVITKTATVDISYLDMVSLDTQTSVTLSSTSSYTLSKTAGVALNDALTGEQVTCQVFGVLDDVSFNYPINEPLFLQTDGTIGTAATTASGTYLTRVGQSYGLGSIFINIEEPVGIV